jgi:broad-specificity NMP kinase
MYYQRMDNVILIGPQRVGKTTVGRLLAAALDRPFVDLNAHARRYWDELGFDEAEEARSYDSGRFENAYRYQRPFQAHAVERGLAEHNGIIELGALQTVYEDLALFERVRQVLRPYPHVILLLPSPDIDESIRVLRERHAVMYEGQEITAYFVQHPANVSVAKHIFYTAGKSPDETCDEVLARIDPSAPEIILIGPPDTGKGTIGALLAQRLGRPRASVDHLRKAYYAEIGYDDDLARRLRVTEGFAALVRYWKQFDLHAVERTLADYPGHIIDFGAGHSVYDDEGEMARLRKVLAPYPNVILLLPSPNADESIALLRERQNQRIGINGVELHRYLLEHPANRALATHTIYTQGQTPEQTCDAILALL